MLYNLPVNISDFSYQLKET